MDNVPSSEERNWAMAAHLCGLAWLAGGWLLTVVGPLVIWRTKGQTMPFVGEQAKESLNFQITVLLLAALSAALIFVLVGFLLLWILAAVNLVLVIIAAIRVSGGQPYRYPFCLRLVK